MAAMISPCRQKPFSIERKPLMLKDYLLDDLSSCSSNGFRAFPRHQCCTTVRFLLEIDLKTKQQQHPKQLFRRCKSSKAASSTISALQRASVAVINAVKLLPFPSSTNSTVKSTSPLSTTTRKGLLPRSLSRKLFKKSFWRKAADLQGQCKEENEIKRWRLFREFLEEQEKQSHQITGRISTSSSSKSHSNIWTPTESEFTADSGNSTNSESCIGGGNDAVEVNNKDLIKQVSGRVGGSVGQDSITKREEWPNEEEKEQFSPVSILDCPFQDDDEEISSPFQRSLIRMEGTKQKLMQKIRRFEGLAHLDPVDLEKRITMAEMEDEKSPIQHCSKSTNDFDETEEQNGTEKDAQELLKFVRSTTASHSLGFKAGSVLLDFFKEKILENNARESIIGSYEEALEQEVEVAKDWINGQPQEMFLGWEVKDCRHVYIEDMEKNGKWKNVDEEKEEVALEVELEAFSLLLDEALLDYIIN